MPKEMSQIKKKDTVTGNTLISLWKDSNFVFWMLLFVLGAIFLYALRSILMPFVLGGILGYLFDPLAIQLQKLKISRTTATLLVFLIVILVAVPTLLFVIGALRAQITSLMEGLPKYMATLNTKTEPLFSYVQTYIPAIETDHVKTIFSKNVAQSLEFAGKLLQSLFKNGVAVFNLFSLILITPVVTFYMLRDWDLFIKKADNLLPRNSKKNIENIFYQIDLALSGFIRGQLTVCVILGFYYAVALKAVGLELGGLVGFIAGLISFIPYVGSITGFVLSMILAFSTFNDWMHILAVVAIFIIGQFVEGNFLTPKLVGDKVGLHPLLIMFALLAGGVLLGFLGLMIAVPIAAIIGVVVRTGLKKYKASSLYLNG